ncbi:MAG: argininosuccinate lyase [Nannocystaceae bacterium]|nr:argininosuccinate lyase [bacterium]
MSGTKSIARTAATGGALDREFLAWSTSLPIDIRLLEEDCRGSVAHVQGLRAGGLLTDDEADTLIGALKSLPAKVASGEVVLQADEEDVHMAVESWLREAVGDVAGKLHTGRSRNDQVATDLKLWCRDAVGRLESQIEGVLVAAAAWSQRHAEVVMPAYTHRQVAIPTMASVWMEAALTLGLQRDRALLSGVREELAESPLGGGAVGGTTLPVDTSVSAEALGFERPPANPIDAIGQRDHALLLVFVCARIGLHLGRFSADVIELASDGLVKLGGAIAGGSSMMPHKRNPDLFELVRGQSALRQGELVQLMVTFQGLGAGYHRDLQQDKQVLFAAVDGVIDTLRMIEISLSNFEVLAEPSMRALIAGDAVATDLCEGLVAGGMAFRDAYGRVGALVAAQRDAGKRLADLTAADLEAAGLDPALTERLDPELAAKRRAARFG